MGADLIEGTVNTQTQKETAPRTAADRHLYRGAVFPPAYLLYQSRL